MLAKAPEARALIASAPLSLPLRSFQFFSAVKPRPVFWPPGAPPPLIPLAVKTVATSLLSLLR